MSLKIAYLINQYPKVSHSFIRREILALEAEGMEIARFSVRSCAEELVDEADKQELEKTRFILGSGILNLLMSLVRVAITRPIRFLNALKLAWNVGWRSERGLLYHFAYLAEACVLLGWLSEAGSTHIHAHFGTNSTTVAMLCEALGGPPYSFTIHGPEEFDKVSAIALPEKIKRSAFAVAISSFGRSQLYRWCDLNHWSKIHVIHCGVDQAFLNQPATPIPEEPRLVCVGRLCEDKGQLFLIHAAKQLAAEGLTFKLTLVGDGPIRSDLEALIAEYDLGNSIEITGWASSTEVRQHLLNSRAMILPSFAEGLPVVIMEALALGRPVISTTIAGIPELVTPGVCGWLVPPSSVQELTDAMRAALTAPVSQLEEMGRAGAERVSSQHNITTEANKLATLLHTHHSALQSTDEMARQAIPYPHLPIARGN